MKRKLNQPIQDEKQKKSIIFRVFAGPEHSAHRSPFFKAVTNLKLRNPNVSVECLTSKKIREATMTIDDVVDWLLGKDTTCRVIHIILCHVHQTMTKIDLAQIRNALNRLTFHEGFPTGIELQCPAFNQDKFSYLSSIPQFTNPTMKVVLPFRETKRNVDVIKRFLQNENEGKGWIVKKPYVTNTVVKFCPDYNKVFEMLRLATRQRGYECMPYVLIQAWMINRKEYKNVCLNGEPLYVANIRTFGTLGTAFSHFPHVEMFDFVRNAIRSLKSEVPGFMCEGLVRVDVFMRQDGRFVVNEFESFEAGVCGAEHQEAKVVTFLEKNWETKMEKWVGR